MKITLASWSAEIAALLEKAANGDLEDIAAQVESGAAQVFEVCSGGQRLAAFALRIDRCATGAEGVIIAAGGNGEGINLTASCLPAIERMFINCQRIRIHTARTGLAKVLAGCHGYRVAELVLTKEC